MANASVTIRPEERMGEYTSADEQEKKADKREKKRVN